MTIMNIWKRKHTLEALSSRSYTVQRQEVDDEMMGVKREIMSSSKKWEDPKNEMGKDGSKG